MSWMTLDPHPTFGLMGLPTGRRLSNKMHVNHLDTIEGERKAHILLFYYYGAMLPTGTTCKMKAKHPSENTLITRKFRSIINTRHYKS